MSRNSDPTIIQVESLTKRFGQLVAANRISYGLKRNEVSGIIGSNGSGKTTLFNLITGYYRPDEGMILYEGRDVTRSSPQKRVAMGITRTFQLTSTFENLRVIDNLILAWFRPHCEFSIRNMLLTRLKRQEGDDRIQASLMAFQFGSVAHKETRHLSLGEKRRLEIAMALITEPKVLLLDEPLAGLSETEISEVLDVLRENASNQTILIVEHKITKIKGFVSRLTIMHEGGIIADGEYEEVLNAPEARKSYWQIN